MAGLRLVMEAGHAAIGLAIFAATETTGRVPGRAERVREVIVHCVRMTADK